MSLCVVHASSLQNVKCFVSSRSSISFQLSIVLSEVVTSVLPSAGETFCLYLTMSLLPNKSSVILPIGHVSCLQQAKRFSPGNQPSCLQVKGIVTSKLQHFASSRSPAYPKQVSFQLTKHSVHSPQQVTCFPSSR